MQLSYQWLQTWVKPDWSLDTLVERLTAAGLELEGVQAVGADHYLDIKITPNRGDALSVLGVAREIALLSETAYTPESFDIASVTSSKTQKIVLQTLECPYYCGRMIENIKPQSVTPDWMKARLAGSQISLIHPVVDILNYVMLELGQPMHAFDLATLQGVIVVRESKAGESLTLLDNRNLVLQQGALCITDDRGPIALAGMMGGLHTGVTEKTTSVFLESAWFEPTAIARQGRLYGVQSDSAYRYERGVDTHLAEYALERATQLLVEICGGQVGPITQVGAPRKQADTIFLRDDRIASVLGIAVEAETTENILRQVGCAIKTVSEGWEVVPPSYRLDITLEVDLIEEIGRVCGYEVLPNMPLELVLHNHPVPESCIPEARILSGLLDRGYDEVITYSFVSEGLQAWADPKKAPKKLLNPITQEMSCMRTQVWPSLVETWVYNKARQQAYLKMIELGQRYTMDGAQESVVAGLWAGRFARPNWSDAARMVDFFDVKGDLEGLFALWGLTPTFEAIEHPALHPGQSAQVLMAGEPIGIVGALHPKIQATLDLTEPVFVFEFLVQSLAAVRTVVQPISRFPSIRRDLAILLPQSSEVAQVISSIQKVVGVWLADCMVFDVYQGKGIPPGQKSIALGLILQHPERTFIDEEVECCIEQVKQALHREHGATLRD